MNDVLIKYSQIGEIFDCLSLGVIILSSERKITGINRTAEQLTGCRESDVIGKHCYNIFRDFLCSGICKFLDADDSRRPSIISGINISDQIGNNTCITKIESPIYSSDGHIIGCIEVFQDHSIFKQLIRRIRFDDLRMKLILDNLDISILTIDRGEHIYFFNSRAESLTGFPRSEVLGKHYKEVLGKKFSKNMTETEIVTYQGQTIPVQVNHMLLKNEQGLLIGGLITLSDLSLKYQLDSAVRDRYTFYDMVGKDPSMQRIFDIVPVVAASDVTILIEGSTGTGKDLLTKIIHNTGPRADKPLIKVNCAALPDTLLESEMFGYVKGAFTGAERDKPGRFQLADSGTILLNEISDMPLSLQAKLLRVLEDKEFYPLGSRKTVKVDVRIISATNQNLETLVQKKLFREDLFYRLNVLRLELPALKDRQSDLPLLISHILHRLCTKHHIPIKKVSNPAMKLLLSYTYPGNIRELENILEHALIICQGTMIEYQHLPLCLLKKRTFNKEPLEESEEKKKIISTLKQHNWHRGLTATYLGIDRSTLWRKIKKYQIKL